jgi:hypothetical protein
MSSLDLAALITNMNNMNMYKLNSETKKSLAYDQKMLESRKNIYRKRLARLSYPEVAPKDNPYKLWKINRKPTNDKKEISEKTTNEPLDTKAHSGSDSETDKKVSSDSEPDEGLSSDSEPDEGLSSDSEPDEGVSSDSEPDEGVSSASEDDNDIFI